MNIGAGQTIGNYQIDTRIRDTTLGALYRADEIDNNRTVALHIFDEGLVAQIRQQEGWGEIKDEFIKGVKKIIMIRHPNLLANYAVHLDNEQWYIVTEDFAGRPLSEYIKTQSSNSTDSVPRIGLMILDGLKYAWENTGVCHVGLSPANIFLTDSNNVKIAGWGLSQFHKVRLASGFHPGSESPDSAILTQYQAPELVDGFSEPNQKFDIYSLGAILYSLCTGNPPFGDRKKEDLHKSQMQKEYVPIFELKKEMPLNLISLIDSMLEPNPEDRVADYDEIHAAFSALSNDQSNMIPCPSCSQKLPVEIDEIGQEMVCSFCNHSFTVPNFLTVFSIRSIGDDDIDDGQPKPADLTRRVPPRPLTDDERDTLRTKIGMTPEKLDALDGSIFWEYAVTADILRTRLTILTTVKDLEKAAKTPGNVKKRSRKTFNALLKNECHRILELKQSIYKLLIENLEDDITGHAFEALAGKANEIDAVLADLSRHHQTLTSLSFPSERFENDMKQVVAGFIKKKSGGQRLWGTMREEDPYQRLRSSIIEWVPYYCNQISELITELGKRSKLSRDTSFPKLDIALNAPTTHCFFKNWTIIKNGSATSVD